MKLKPKHKWIKGMELETINPEMPKMRFPSPFLDSRGDALREAIKQHRKFLADQEQIQSEQNNESQQQKINDLVIDMMAASVMQAYVVSEGDDCLENYRQAILENFTEDDLEIYTNALNLGKVLTKAEMIDFLQENREILKEKNAGESQTQKN